MNLITTLGPKSAAEAGMILPHEHVFVDLRTWDQPGYAEAEIADVIRLMAPELERARQAGIGAIVECSPVGVGRRADILKAVSEAAAFPLVAPTGIYREPWVPRWAHEASEDQLYEWMLLELSGEIESSGVQAGFIKLSAGNDGLTATEAKILRAAGRAGREAGAAIGSHTIRGPVVEDQLQILESLGFPVERFIWIHAHLETSFAHNLALAQRGIWIEYDCIGDPQHDPVILQRTLRLLEAGFADRLLLSHDRGWYTPAEPGGGTPRPFTVLSESFLPQLRQSGVDEKAIRTLTRDNPFRAFAR